MVGKSDAPSRAPIPEPNDPARSLAGLYEGKTQTVDGQIRPENLLSAAAAVAGECTLRVAGGLDARQQALPPGSLVLSPRVDQLLFAGQDDWTTLPETTVFGALRKEALYRGYEDADFPSIAGIIQLLANPEHKDGDAGPGRGRVPLGLGQDYQPRLSPIQEAYLLRKPVTLQLTNWGVPLRDQPVTCARAAGRALDFVKGDIDPRIALQIVCATINGMAKMAPMTARHMKEMQLRVGVKRLV